MLNTEERKQRKLKKDLSATRQVLNESFKDKNNIEKQLSAEIEGFRYQVFTLSKALHEKKVQVETLKKEKGMLMFYYQDKLCELNQNKSTSEPETNTPAICSPALDKSVQESYLQSTANILKNKVLDLESHVYRHEKLTEALVDIIQSHDPDFELEEEGILQSYVDQKKGSSSEGPPLHLNDLYLEPGCSNDLDLYTAVPGRYHNEGGDLVSSISTDTCATADSPQSGLSSAGSLDADTYETSTSFSDTDTCSLYSDFPTNGSS